MREKHIALLNLRGCHLSAVRLAHPSVVHRLLMSLLQQAWAGFIETRQTGFTQCFPLSALPIAGVLVRKQHTSWLL